MEEEDYSKILVLINKKTDSSNEGWGKGWYKNVNNDVWKYRV